jgi:hypothetical protein
MVKEECNLLRSFYAFAGKKGTKTKIKEKQDKNVVLIKRKAESNKTAMKIKRSGTKVERTKKVGKT